MKPLTWLVYAAVATASGGTAGSYAAPAAFAAAGLRLDVLVATDSRSEREAIRAADLAHAAASAAGLAAGFPAALDDDAVFLYPGRPVARGRAAVEALVASLPGADRQHMSWYPVRVDVSADGTRGYSYGYGERTRPDSTGALGTAYIKYIAYWRKGDDARWRVAAWALLPGGTADAAAGQPRTAPKGCETPSADYARAAYAARDSAPKAAPVTGDVLLRVDSDFSARSVANGGAPAFASFVADDGASIGGAGPIDCGREAVRARFANVKAGDLVWTPAIADVAASGDLGFTVGVAASRHGAQTFYSKYLTIWRRQPDGAWRFVADGGNAAPAPER